MSALRKILGDRYINGLMVAFVIGFATVSFVNSAGSMAFNTLLKTGGANVWVWKVFWGDLFLYICSIIAALIINSFARKG